ncbi:hypothetical protein DSO57_1032789 [Entomophthora muscae]|uniref:Uncharacterized protein n=1 Tax=Entomophthora muscae TaxID=34485 RepID=A0ACC2S2I5_9FUNG|nr:hypothetical protein DSO57_1032789 [Entomophthora muscae]
MSIRLGEALLSVDTTHGRKRCDQCYASHRKCDRAVPSCGSCLRLNGACTRRRHGFKDKVLSLLPFKACYAAPNTWMQVTHDQINSLIKRFIVRRYIMSLDLSFPSLTVAKKMVEITAKPAEAHFIPPIILNPALACSFERIHHLFPLAIQTFFSLVNPFQPIFSQQAFHATPRSSTLRKIIIHIGLERMPPSNLTRAALKHNGFDASQLTKLPPSLDTLQCLNLARFFVFGANIAQLRFRIYFLANALLLLLGLHIYRPKSARWLEYTLLVHLDALALYNRSSYQFPEYINGIWIDTSTRHLNPSFLPTMTNLNHFPYPSDRIHFITSQTMYHSYSIVIQVYNEYEAARRSQIHPQAFFSKLQPHLLRLHENFLWGWGHLTHLVHTSTQKTLLTRSRLTLAIRYFNDHIQIIKLTSKLPQSDLATTQAHHRQNGLKLSIHTINLISTLNPAPFSFDYVLAAIPSLAFIMANLGKNTPELHRALSIAQSHLKICQRHKFCHTKAKTYLQLIEFCQTNLNLTK